MDQAGPSRITRKKPLVITVPRGLLRQSLQKIIPTERSRICFVINGSEIKLLTPSDRCRFDLSRLQHLPSAPSCYTGFRDLRSPSPTGFEFPAYDKYASRPEIYPPEHGRNPPAPLSPIFAMNPFSPFAPNKIHIPPAQQLPRHRKVMSKLAKRRGVYIHPLTGKMKIIKRRTHSKSNFQQSYL
ncbi:unnamed protein product [Cercopithifilaria johnstoni]|uniref:Uncharacterized protein n=1 Tax=Cercopithifilaria johnstoni TaxID=2874296 RepID=A0A8J2LVN9_9BILA|nr:unnamed protein product [Cercopithifilaria johnstoni]